MQVVPGALNGLDITPVSPADDADTAVSMFVWMYSVSRSAADGIIGRGQRGAGLGGINLGMHWSQGGTGRIWIEYAVTGADMGGSTYVDFLNEIVVLNQWQLIGCVVDLSLSGNARFKVFSALPGMPPVEWAPTRVFGTPPANFSTMNNGDLKVGQRLGFYNNGNNASTRWFREPAYWTRALTTGEITTLADVNPPATPTLHVPLEPTGASGIVEQVSARSTALVGAAALSNPASTGWPFETGSIDPVVAPPGSGDGRIADPPPPLRPALRSDATRTDARGHVAVPDQSRSTLALQAPADRSGARARIALKLDAPFRAPTTGPTPPPTFPPTGACVAAVDRLIEQLRRRTNVLRVLCSLADRAQPIFNALGDVKNFRSLAVATGQQLDELATLYGTSRAGRTDDELRAYLNGLVIVVSTKGTAEDLIAGLVRLDNGFALAAISLTNLYPAAVILTCLVPAGQREVGASHAQVLRRIAPAGVNFQLHFEQQSTVHFVWDGDTGEGFAVETDPVGTGGVWAEAL